MPYVIMMCGDYSDPERGVVHRKWAVNDENGKPLLFTTRQEALEFEASLRSRYEGVAYWNVLAPGQYAGYRGKVVWVSADPQKRPYWAR